MEMAKMPVYDDYNYYVINTFPSYKMSIITIILSIKILNNIYGCVNICFDY